MPGDVPLPISENPSDPWSLEHEPTTLIASWPGDLPTQTEVLALLEQSLFDGVMELLGEPPAGADDVRWAAVVRVTGVPHLASPIFIWCEPSRPAPPNLPEAKSIDACRWVIGFETFLDPEDAVTSITEFIRLAARTCPSTPCILDTGSMTWHVRRELDEIFLNPAVEPPAEILWTIHAVCGDEADNTQAADVWLHTHGLWRCGKPELEMLGVPRPRTGEAGNLINAVAELLLEREAPKPGEHFEIGVGLTITLQPWKTVASRLESDLPGSMRDRQPQDNPHVGQRAVICAEKPVGLLRKHWTWPEQVLDRLSYDESAVYHTSRATRRQAAIARSTWDELATAFVKLDRAKLLGCAERKAVVLIKAGFTTDSAGKTREPSHSEHLWFDIARFDRHRAEGTLINQPIDVASLTRGKDFWIERESVSDWTVFTPLGKFEPKDIASLWRAVDQLTRV